MRKLTILFLGLCLGILFLPQAKLFAQQPPAIKGDLTVPDSSHFQILTTQDGSTIIGRIVEIGEAQVQFETEMGRLTVPITKIKEIKEVPVTSIKHGEYWFPNPNATRLFFSPTGRMQKKGEGYFADYYVFFPMVAYGVTDHFGIGGGITLIPFIGLKNQIVYIMPRVGFTQENWGVAAGLLLAKMPAELTGAVGILYGVGTYGSLDASLTAGLGYGFVTYEGEIGGMRLPMFMVGGEKRLGRRVSLVTENWIIPEIETDIPVVLSYGVRLFGEAISVDLGFITIPALYLEGDLPWGLGIPYVDFVWNF